jgi:ArsR family transcriptional regulator, zinc-responsive transcriptional repressor
MKEQYTGTPQPSSGDELLRMLSALASPHRLRIVAALTSGRNYVSQLARELGVSRPLIHMHLRRLEAAGLVSSEMEVSDDGKAMNYYELRPLDLLLTPELIAEAARTLTTESAAGEAMDADDEKEEGR